MLRHQLGITTSSAQSDTQTTLDSNRDQENVEMTLDKCLEMFKEFDTEIKALHNAYQDKEKAS